MRPIDRLFPQRQSLIEQGICTMCSADAKEFKDELSKKEHGISGMCQSCQDKVFEAPDEEDEDEEVDEDEDEDEEFFDEDDDDDDDDSDDDDDDEL